jgi:2-haloacid dehalogenase
MLKAAGSLRVLAFDVFGTVVDWHSGVARAVDALGLPVDGSTFALAWRAGYSPAMQRVASGEIAWTLIDDLHRGILDALLARFGITHLSEADKHRLNQVWHRLDGWPDAIDGLARLKSKYLVCTLSNGNLGLLSYLAKHARLPWDCILSAETFHAYKPDPQTYLGVARVFDVPTHQVLMVASHHDDLVAARACGLLTAHIERPHEYGANRDLAEAPDLAATLRAGSIADLATQLGC